MHLALRLSYRWLLFLVLCCAAPAAAQPAANAEGAAPLADPLAALLEQARALMTRGEPAAALQVLEQAQGAPPDPRVTFARTHALSALGRHPEAAQSLESYLRAPPQDSASAAQVADAQRWLDGYQRSLSRLTVRVALPPLSATPSLTLNDSLVGPLPGGALEAPLWLYPGAYQVRVSAPALRSYQVSLTLQPGELREVLGVLEAESQPQQVTRPSVPGAPVRRRPLYKSVLLWTLVGVGAVVVTGIVVGAIVGGSSHSSSHHD